MKRYSWLLLVVGVVGYFSVTAVRLLWAAGEGETAVAANSPFVNTGQTLDNRTTLDVALADLDGDQDIDAFTASSGGANLVWLNDGFGQFSSNGQSLGSADSEAVALAELDGNPGLDAFVANSDGANQVWLNDGSGQFSNSGQNLGSGGSRGVALGDLDGDNDVDAFVANDGGNTVWFNDGNGTFSDSGQSLGTLYSNAVALGDLDGDNDLDAFVANGISGPQPDKVWLNDGDGAFSDLGQDLNGAWTYDVALGDLDGDNDLDAFTASWSPNANLVWLNDGGGNFSNSGQSLGSAASLGVVLGDVDGDTDPDAVVANNTPEPSQVWLNDGDGGFSSGQGLDTGTTAYAPALADLNGDNTLDLFLGQFGPDAVWLNNPSGVPDALFDVARATNDDGDDVYYWAGEDDALLPVMLSHPVTQTVTVYARVEMSGATPTTPTIPYNPGEQVKFLNLVNPQPDPSVPVTLTLRVAVSGSLPGPPTDQLLLMFVDGEQGDETCLLCYSEWLGRLTGFQVGFWPMHHADLSEQEETPQWTYYSALFHVYSPEVTGLIADHPALLWQSLDTFSEWTPAVESLGNGTGSTYTITTEMADDLDQFFAGVGDEGGPGLSAVIQQERTALDVPSFAGMNMEEAWDELVARRPIEETFITIILADGD